jgi:hypothetical protein
MHIGVVDAALVSLDNDLQDTGSRKGSTFDRLYSVMNDKPSKNQPANKPDGKRQTTAHDSSTKMNPGFDMWLGNKLHQMFDAVAAEPLPADLLKLLDQLDKKTQPPQSENEDKKNSRK